MGRVSLVIVVLLVLLFGAAAIFSVNNQSGKSTQAWNTAMAKGDAEATNSFIEYTDITCPHCADFHNAIADSSFETDYINSGKVRFEIRVTSMLEGKSVNSVRAGESAYCAADQGKFFEYYDGIVKQFTKDYFDKGIGVSATSADIPKLEDSYYLTIAKDKGLDSEVMKSCLDEGKMLPELNKANQKTVSLLPYGSGVPYFVVNKFTSSGFGGDYTAVQQMMRAGGIN